ncbi:hypothetical protein [Mucilaginibacter gilvus]|uniref:Uncharacterized protein n=1 Tax=Mucilaginibacter gilvus TaxID=2305909 RepID=A0A3S3UJQ2_9SPHI|nr:hypothetical protein [Mucilaginibacter gilvus]RWY47983.1 hypothetical protein EPL05_20545 [Mucilaginibacter gilvus]
MYANPILYLKLLGITVLSVFVCIFIAVSITGSRESGMAYGIYAGIITGNLITTMLGKRPWLFVIIQLFLYCIILGGLLYALLYSSFMPLADGLSVVVIVLSMIIALEGANYLAGRLSTRRLG